MKKIAILGASGSIGMNTIEVIRRHPDQFQLVAFSVYSSVTKILPLLQEFKTVEVVGVRNLEEITAIRLQFPHILFQEQEEGLNAVATSSCDMVVSALVGFVGLKPTLKAIKARKTIALANKETLVAAGEIVNEEAKKNGVKIIPIDSEHSAIYQCLEEKNKIKKIILTASGGPFYQKSLEELKKVALDDALKHPNWKMGTKITIDSATMFNKAFEVIEAYYLFHVKKEQIEVVIHPQSIAHSFVEFEDGAMKAQLGVADMKVAISYALMEKERLDHIAESLSLSKVGTLQFFAPNEYQQKVLNLAYEALERKGVYPTILNAANEEAVQLFLNHKISYLEIYECVVDTLKHQPFDFTQKVTLDSIFIADDWARQYIRRKFA